MRVRNICHLISTALSLALLVAFTSPSFGQLYTEDFDDLGASTRWNANAGVGFDDDGSGGIGAQGPMDTSFDQLPVFPDVDGIPDTFDDFAFDYSTHGIPAAPNGSDPNSTIGMRLRANLFSNRFGGFSVSPTGLNLTGDYAIKFDYWGSSVGQFPFGGSSSTMVSTFGLLTAGTESQTPLNVDGVYFGVTADGGSGSDYRVYSAARTFSHQLITDPNNPDPIDAQADYLAGSRNGSAVSGLYCQAVNDPNCAAGLATFTVPTSVSDAAEALYGDPNGDPNDFIMAGNLFAGAGGFQWHEMEIRRVGHDISWIMNGINIVNFSTSDWFDPNTPFNDPNSNGVIGGDPNTAAFAGGNISFGHHDINFNGPADDESRDFVYTLIDNIVVEAITAADDADFDDDGLVTGLDFLTYQENYPITDGSAINANGDADGDGDVTTVDLAIWGTQYGGAPPVAAVPEPATLLSWLVMSVLGLFGYRPCRSAVE